MFEDLAELCTRPAQPYLFLKAAVVNLKRSASVKEAIQEHGGRPDLRVHETFESRMARAREAAARVLAATQQAPAPAPEAAPAAPAEKLARRGSEKRRLQEREAAAIASRDRKARIEARAQARDQRAASVRGRMGQGDTGMTADDVVRPASTAAQDRSFPDRLETIRPHKDEPWEHHHDVLSRDFVRNNLQPRRDLPGVTRLNARKDFGIQSVASAEREIAQRRAGNKDLTPEDRKLFEKDVAAMRRGGGGGPVEVEKESGGDTSQAQRRNEQDLDHLKAFYNHPIALPPPDLKKHHAEIRAQYKAMGKKPPKPEDLPTHKIYYGQAGINRHHELVAEALAKGKPVPKDVARSVPANYHPGKVDAYRKGELHKLTPEEARQIYAARDFKPGQGKTLLTPSAFAERYKPRHALTVARAVREGKAGEIPEAVWAEHKGNPEVAAAVAETVKGGKGASLPEAAFHNFGNAPGVFDYMKKETARRAKKGEKPLISPQSLAGVLPPEQGGADLPEVAAYKDKRMREDREAAKLPPGRFVVNKETGVKEHRSGGDARHHKVEVRVQDPKTGEWKLDRTIEPTLTMPQKARAKKELPAGPSPLSGVVPRDAGGGDQPVARGYSRSGVVTMTAAERRDYNRQKKNEQRGRDRAAKAALPQKQKPVGRSDEERRAADRERKAAAYVGKRSSRAALQATPAPAETFAENPITGRAATTRVRGAANAAREQVARATMAAPIAPAPAPPVAPPATAKTVRTKAVTSAPIPATVAPSPSVAVAGKPKRAKARVA